MDPLKIDQKHLESIRSRLLEKGIHLSLEEVNRVADLIKDWHGSGAGAAPNP